jgi:xanthine/CO dehydrogenase XdhC/CoxF family maturation factor
MKEIQEILKRIELLEPNEKAILATVVDVQGSSYRLPGAKMLILENGDTFGTVSGGCLEADILERAKQVLETGKSDVFTYDTTKDVDSVFSLNMGCRGIIRILLEPIGKSSSINFLRFCHRENKAGAFATIVKSQSYKIGTNFFARGIDEIDNIFHQENIFPGITKVFEEAFTSEKSRLETFEDTEIFVDYISASISLVIFGAGADAVPLAEIAKGLGWRVKVVDHRTKFANKERFKNADEILISHPENTAENIEVDENSVAVIMTHNYEHDKNVLKVLLKSDAKYVGKLGPKRRSENMLREFAEEGLEFTDEQLNKFYSPIGLDLGADTPEGIALSIVAEINAVLKGREGGFLRNRTGSIYGRD